MGHKRSKKRDKETWRLLIPNTGAILCGVVLSKDRELLQLANSDLGQEGHQVVGDALRILSHDTAGMGASGVEISQQDCAPLVIDVVPGSRFLKVLLLLQDRGHTEILDDVLQKDLCPAIGAHGGDDGRSLWDGDAGRVAIDGGRGRKDNLANVELFHDLQQVDGARDVDIVVIQGDAARFTDSLAAGEMDHGRDLGVGSKDGGESGLVENVDLVEGNEILDRERGILVG